MPPKKIQVKKTEKAATPHKAVVSHEKKHPVKYIEAVGRRKTSVARVRLMAGEKGIVVNKMDIGEYFPNKLWQDIVKSPLTKTNLENKFGVSVKVNGGGVNSQAEAIRHGIARTLVMDEPALRGVLKAESFLKRDPRMKERRKYGLKKARRAPQWSKR